MSDQHEMVLVRTHDTGAEEWLCRVCQRRILLHWPPDYKKIVLEAGDESASHVGHKKGSMFEIADSYYAATHPDDDVVWEVDEDIKRSTRPREDGILLNPISLEPWVKWMEEVGLA